MDESRARMEHNTRQMKELERRLEGRRIAGTFRRSQWSRRLRFWRR